MTSDLYVRYTPQKIRNTSEISDVLTNYSEMKNNEFTSAKREA